MDAAVWRDYMEGKNPSEHTVVGKWKVLEGVYSPQLENRRNVLVYLQPSYDQSDRRYPVIYMHDGQNLFDAATGFVGEWQVDETLEMLADEGIEAIVVGIPNMSKDRIHELSPFKDAESKGWGDKYLSFIVETIKPMIDAEFRTFPDRLHTGIMGSSMGGLISLYGYFTHPNVFGWAGVVSPALWFGNFALFAMIEHMSHVPQGKIYMDVGTNDAGNLNYAPDDIPRESLRYLNSVQEMRDLLARKGYKLGRDLMYIEYPGAVHNESAWAQRLPDALRFLLSN